MRNSFTLFAILLALIICINAETDAQDDIAPTVSINTPQGVQTGEFMVTVVFSEAVTGFLQSELVVTGTAGASITGWDAQTGGTNYVATITPANDGDVVFNVAADVAEDTDNNQNTIATEQTIQVRIPETVWMPDANLRRGVKNALGMQQDEALTQAAMARLLTLQEGNASFLQSLMGLEYATNLENLNTSHSKFDDITVLSGLTNLRSLDLQNTGIDANDITVLSGLTNLSYLNLQSNNIDDITVLGGLTNLGILFLGGNNIVDITALEDLTDLTSLDLAANNIVDITALEDLTDLTSLDLGGNNIVDITALEGLTQLSDLWLQDNPFLDLYPIVEIGVPTDPQHDALDVAISFNEAVTGFEQEDLEVNGAGATITNWVVTTEDREYTATITPTQDGTVTFDIANGIAQGKRKQVLRDLFQTNLNLYIYIESALDEVYSLEELADPNKAATQQSVQVDMTRPKVSIDVPSDAQNGAFEVTVVFSESVTGFQQSEFVVSGTSGSSITGWNPQTGGTDYVATITPSQTGTAIFNVAANVAKDTAENENTSAPQQTVQVDMMPPSVGIDVPSTPQNGAFEVTVVFNEEVTGFSQSELVVSGMSGSVITGWNAKTGGTDYVATVTPSQTGTAIFYIAANVAKDAAENGNTAATEKTVQVDMTSPTVSIGVPSGPQSGVFEVMVVFSEEVTGFSQSELVVSGTSNATITGWDPQTGGTDYIATITPTQTGTAIFNVAANVAKDTAENENTAAPQQTVQVDKTRPTVNIDVPAGTQGGVFEVTVIFRESVSDFIQSELVVTGTSGASITGWSPQTGGTEYVATITSTRSGTAIFNVTQDVAQDNAENKNTAATQQTVQVDMDLPSVRIDVPSVSQNGVFEVTVVFSESVTGFLQGELVITGTSGASITAWSPQTGGTDYVATVTPSRTGTAIFDIAANVAKDVAENENTAATEKTVQVDMTRPSVSIDVPSDAQKGVFKVTVAFNEAVTGFLRSELVVSGTAGASITDWSPQTGGTNYVATITPIQTGTVIFNVAANVAEDVAGNLNTAATEQSVDVDRTRPSVRIDVPSTPQNGVFAVTVVFDEEVSGFAQAELVVSGTSGSTITGWSAETGGTDYVATITPANEGNVVFNVAANVAKDTAENLNTAATQQNVQVDQTRPTVTINVPSGPQADAFEVTVVFSESVTGFVQSELVVSGTSNATITGWAPQTGGTDYVATITPTQTGTAIFNIAANVAEDQAKNKNTTATQQTVQVDITRPTVSIDIPSDPQNGAFEVTVVFSEEVSGFAQSELVVSGTSNATITGWAPQTGGTDYIATITPTQTGTAIFNVAANVAKDTAENENTAAPQQTVRVDKTRPTVSITVPSDPQGGAFEVTGTFSESVTGFVQSEFVVSGTSNATITGWAPQAGGTDYVATVTPSQTGTAIFYIAANVAKDAAENGNTAATQQSVSVDITRPTVRIDVPSDPQNSAFDVTVTFSESVTGFVQSELVVSGTSGSTITDWDAQAGGTDYVATITPMQTGTAMFSIAANVAEDTAENENTSAPQQTVQVDMMPPSVSIDVPSGPQGGVFEVTVVFSESVTGFVQSELVVAGTSNATITDWDPQTGGTNYVATITPTQTGTAIFNVAANVAKDGAENQNTAASEQTIQVDMTRPTVSIDAPAGTQGGVFEVTVIFSESVSDFVQSELVVTGTSGASITGWSPQTGGTEYVATITSTRSGTAIFNVTANVAQDNAENKNTAAIQQTVQVDTDLSSVRIDVPSVPQNGMFEVTVVFSESVTGFVQAELVITGMSGSSITGWDPQAGGTNYVATITPTQTGTAIFNVVANVAEDEAENGNIAATEKTVQVDMTRPTVRIDVPSAPQNGVFEVTVVFSEEVTGFQEPELVVSRMSDAIITNWDAKTGGTDYVATVTPSQTGTAIFSVAANVATDVAGNQNTAASEQTVQVDKTRPTVRIDIPSGPQGGVFEVTVVFSESVTGFVQGELAISGMSGSSITGWIAKPGGTDYIATVTPSQTGTAIFNVAENVAQDTAGNENTAALSQTVQVDMTRPAVRIDVPSAPQNGAFEVTVVFAEPVSDFVQSELVVSGTSGSSITGWVAKPGGTDYVATITPSQTGTAIFNVAASVAKDAAENGNTAATQQTVQVDMTRPTVRIDTPSGAQNGIFDVTVIFSEPITGFTRTELSVTGTSGSSITGWAPQTGGTNYIATITPSQTGTAIFNVAADVAIDAVENPNTAATQQAVEVDKTLPNVSIKVPSEDQYTPFNVTVTFSEPISDFVQGELAVSGTSGSSITGWVAEPGGTDYVATITPSQTGTAIFNITADVAIDAAGNRNTAAQQQTVALDLDRPRANIIVPSRPQKDTFEVMITFNELVRDFAQEELLVTGTSEARILKWLPQTGGKDYMATVEPTQTGMAVFNVPANIAQDEVGNQNVAASQQMVQVDMTRPTVSIKVPPDIQTGDFQVTVRFSEPVNEFTKGDLFISEPDDAIITGWNAHADRHQYTATITPELDRNLTLAFHIPPNIAVDDARNGNEPAQSEEVGIDTLTPCLTLKVPQGVQTAPFDVQVSFSEPVIDFERSDLQLAGMLRARITKWRVENDGSDYYATIVPSPFKRTERGTPIDSGTLTLYIAEGVAVDKAGNENKTTDVRTVVVTFPGDSKDSKELWAAIEAPTGIQAGAFDVTIVFTEPVNGFSQGDLSINPSQAIIENWTPHADRCHYTATINPQASGTVTLNVAADVAEDDAENGNRAATEKSIVVVFPVIADTEKPTLTIENPSGTFDAVIRFSEPVTGFKQNDLKVSDPCLAITRWQSEPNRQEYVATLTPTRDTTVTLSVPKNVAQDPAGNSNMAAEVKLEVMIPDVRVYIESPTIVRGVFDVTVVFTKPVSGFTQKELLFTDDGTAAARITNWSVQQNRTRYTAEITPTKNGALMLSVAAGAAAKGNAPAQPVRVLISPEDVNQNGTVDAQDASVVTQHLGARVAGEREKNPDVNRDGIVTVEDLALVQVLIGENPTIAAASPETLQSLLEYLKGIEDSDLLLLRPKRTTLLPNYPNPFNPETWIPYQLASDSEVQIFIYNTQGTLIRSLELGSQSAGYYTNKNRAVYWDGTNNISERVASGIYFYRLQAGNLSLLRKMVILK